MQETRRELVDRFMRFIGELNDPNSRQVAEDLVNAVILDIWQTHPFRDFVMSDDYTFATVAGTRTYGLPTFFGRIARRDGRIRNMTNPGAIFPRDRDELVELHPEWGTTQDVNGLPTHYALAGRLGVMLQPPAAGVALEMVSTDPLDIDVYVTVEGNDANGNYTSSYVQLNGTNPVALGTWKPPLVTFAKAWPAAIAPAPALSSSRGTVTLRVVGAGTTYQTLLPFESAREQQQLQLWRTPDAVYTYAIPVIRQPRRLVRDSDAIPAEWGNAIFEGMHIEWMVNTGELSRAVAPTVRRPKLENLVSLDNENRAGNQQFIQPFGMT